MARRLKQWWYVPVIWLFFFLAVSSLVGDSPTMDEQNHVGRGLAFVRSGDPRLSLEHPPLTNAISALPLLTVPEIRVPFDHPSWELQPPDIYWYLFAEQLFWHYGNDVTRMIFLARLPIVFLTLALALVGFHFARLLWQRPSAPLAFVLLLFDPTILAHGRYVTTDLGGTLFVFLATLLLWRMWRHATWAWDRWLLAALGMGLAFGSKLSALVFVPIWGVVALLPLFPQRDVRTAGRRLLQLGMAGLASILVVWAIFGFEWRAFRFQSAWLAELNAVAGPMPTFWAGIEQILALSGQGRNAYLLGQFSTEGFLAYFPIAFLVKTPLPTLLALPAAVIVLLAWQPTRRRALFVLLPALLYFGVTMQSNLNIGYRHLLPTLPFFYVLISGLACVKWQETAVFPRAVRLIPVAAAAGLIVATLLIHPHYLSFFNRAAGGPINGPRLLLDSNIDWGQDLLRLRDWMAQNQVDTVRLGWFGTADPAYFGVNNEPLPGFPRPEYLSQWTVPPFDPANPQPGVYAVSVSSLWELPLPDSGVYAWFRQREPDARVGYSIWIYDVR